MANKNNTTYNINRKNIAKQDTLICRVKLLPVVINFTISSIHNLTTITNFGVKFEMCPVQLYVIL